MAAIASDRSSARTECLVQVASDNRTMAGSASPAWMGLEGGAGRTEASTLPQGFPFFHSLYGLLPSLGDSA